MNIEGTYTYIQGGYITRNTVNEMTSLYSNAKWIVTMDISCYY